MNTNPYLFELIARERQLERLRAAEAHRLGKRPKTNMPGAHRWLEKHVLTQITILKYRLHGHPNSAAPGDDWSLLPW